MWNLKETNQKRDKHNKTRESDPQDKEMVARSEWAGGRKKQVREIKRLRKVFQEFPLQNNSIYFACNIEIFFQYETFQCNHLDVIFQVQTFLLGPKTSHSILGIIQGEN